MLTILCVHYIIIVHKLTCTRMHAHAGSSGSVTFVNVPQRDPDNRFYFLRVVGATADGQRTVIRRGVRVGELSGL